MPEYGSGAVVRNCWYSWRAWLCRNPLINVGNATDGGGYYRRQQRIDKMYHDVRVNEAMEQWRKAPKE